MCFKCFQSHLVNIKNLYKVNFVKIIEKNGFKVKCFLDGSLKDLIKIRGSKYLQFYILDILL